MACAMVECDEGMALTILILNIVCPTLGTLIASCSDKKGCNFGVFALWLLMVVTAPFFLIGWILSIIHGVAIYQHNKGRGKGGVTK